MGGGTGEKERWKEEKKEREIGKVRRREQEGNR
jgi:hypothetical protein